MTVVGEGWAHDKAHLLAKGVTVTGWGQSRIFGTCAALEARLSRRRIPRRYQDQWPAKTSICTGISSACILRIMA